MDEQTVRIVVLAALASIGTLWVLSAFFFRVSGTWERVLTEDELSDGTRTERITLAQLGPIVTGRRDVSGGHQEFSGVMVGRRLTLQRRDHGVRALLALGFPEPVAQKLDGEVMARMRLRLGEGGMELFGTFAPQKVEFTHQPPRVTRTYFLPGQHRRYRRVVEARDRVPRMERMKQADVTEA